jgi:type II restriction enzyme
VDGYLGWNELNTPVGSATRFQAGQLTHSQVQALLAAIGFAKGNDVWCPQADRAALDWSLTAAFPLHASLPYRFKTVEPILAEVDVVWMKRGAGGLAALFEVEHTTTIYSGLLRFNDVHLVAPELHARYSVVANEARRSLFVRQVNRPTFQRSGLAEICTFMEYENVLDWHNRLKSGAL